MSKGISRQEMAELRSLLWLHGVRQETLAPRLGMDPARLSRVLNGKNPAPDHFERDLRQAVKAIQKERKTAQVAA